MKNKEILHPRLKELRRERKSYSFWEIETNLGAIDSDNQAGSKKDKEVGREISDQFFDDLQKTFFRK